MFRCWFVVLEKPQSKQEPSRKDGRECHGTSGWVLLARDVRELENAIERACTLSDGGVIRVSDLPPHILHDSAVLDKTPESEWRVGQQLDDFVRHQERKYIEMTLKFNEGSREKTASMLGISIATLYRKLDLKHHRE